MIKLTRATGLVPALGVVVALWSGCRSEAAAPSPEAAAPPAKEAAPPPNGEAAPPPAAEAAPADWCGGHGLPESKCTKCNPELIEEYKAAGDWCAEHEFPESACPQCNPQELPAGPTADWCIEHALPESKCPKCNPELLPELRDSGDWCPEHGFPESVCPVCNPQAPPAGAEQAAIEARVVLLDPPSMEDAAGIKSTAVRSASAVDSVECTAKIAFDTDRLADVRALVPGVVRKVSARLGEQVEKGAPLFHLESTRVGELQATLQTAKQRVRTARANLARQRELRKGNIASQRQVEVALQELAAARGQAQAAEGALEMAGANDDGALGQYVLKTPIAGLVVRRPAVQGLYATADTSLATVADTSTMWALCDVPEADVGRIGLGQPMSIKLEGGGKSFRGEITWIAAEVDPRTRTVTARAEIPNPDGHLRANQFARARIDTSESRTAVAVPRASVQRVAGQEVVFIRTRKGAYQPRVVRRIGDGEVVQVEGEVKAGDQVVTEGAVLLRTEVMPGSIGAGCCEVPEN